MKHTENNTQKTVEPTGSETSQPVVVSGPSCPAAFARWWAEYREKVMKAFPINKSVFALEGRQ